MENISLVEDWTRAIFDNIEVVTAHERFDGGEFYTSYTDGDYFAPLLEQVGEAHSIYIRTIDGISIKRSTWINGFGEDIFISIDVSVDVETDMIVGKNIFG